MNTIKAIVKFNDGIGLVLNEPIVKVANKYGNTIIESNGVFFSSLVYDRPSPGFRAFAGRKFDIHFENGETEHCEGQWWDGISDKTREIVGDDIISVTAQCYDDLKKCYVFCAHYASKARFAEFIKSYTGKIYGYWEYEAIVRDLKKLHVADKIDFRKAKNFRRFKKKILVGPAPELSQKLLAKYQ